MACPFFAHTSITTSTKEGEGAENSYTSDMYLQTVDGVNTAYAGYNGVWYKQQVETDDFTYSVSQYNPVENGLTAVSIISDKSVDGDGLSTTCFVLGLDKGMELINSIDGVEAVFIDENEQYYFSDGFGKDIIFNYPE